MFSVLTRQIVLPNVLIKTSAVFFFVLGISLGAFLRIPLGFTPVPITMQTFFVLLSAAVLGLRLGLFTQLIYIFLGAVGLPVFAVNLFYFRGPTLGYIFGFVIATILINYFIEDFSDRFFSLALLFFFADLVLLLLGTFWLKIYLNLNWSQAFYLGFWPFVLGDFLKAFLAAKIFFRFAKRINSIFR